MTLALAHAHAVFLPLLFRSFSHSLSPCVVPSPLFSPLVCLKMASVLPGPMRAKLGDSVCKVQTRTDCTDCEGSGPAVVT